MLNPGGWKEGLQTKHDGVQQHGVPAPAADQRDRWQALTTSRSSFGMPPRGQEDEPVRQGIAGPLPAERTRPQIRDDRRDGFLDGSLLFGRPHAGQNRAPE